MTYDLGAVRSVLFLPASNPRAIAKARASSADLVILDLEDAVKPEGKETARQAAVEALRDPWPMPLAVRINGRGTPWHDEDIAALSGEVRLAVLPRAGSGEDVKRTAKSLDCPVMAMVETAAGVLAAPGIAVESAALIAGTNDLRADLRLPADASRGPISASLQMIVLAARAVSIPVYDGVFNHLTDDEGFAAECAEGRMLGFDGKSLIHPSQIEPCNRIFSPSEAEVERARRLIAAFGGGAERFEDRMIERMHIEAAHRALARSTK